MVKELTAAEVRKHTQATDFSACFCEDGSSYFLSWVQHRGKIEQGGGDSGTDLMVMKQGGLPQVLVRGEELSGGIIFSPSGTCFCFQTCECLMWGNTKDFHLYSKWVTLPAGESFCGMPVWLLDEAVMYGVRGGTPKRDRLFLAPRFGQHVKERLKSIFIAKEGATLLSWDCYHDQEDNDRTDNVNVVLVHRLANAMLAEIVYVGCKYFPGSQIMTTLLSSVLAIDCCVEYCKPQAAFLENGSSILLRLNALFQDNNQQHLTDAALLNTLPPGTHYSSVVHGLWLYQMNDEKLEPLDVVDGWAHGSYDVCSNSYGKLGACEGFRLDAARTKVLVTARQHTRRSDHHLQQKSYADELYLVDFATQEKTRCIPLHQGEGAGYYGCMIPVAVSETQIIFHFRSPTESGDLYLTDVLPTSGGNNVIKRLTETMPVSLKQKLVAPTEVMVTETIHALLFAPKEEESVSNKTLLQPLVWLHGGPLAQYSYDCNPLLNWLASLGYLVLVPNFSGSTGNGIQFMSQVLGSGCGVADLADCLACATWFQWRKDSRLDLSRLDLSRGVAVAGHSWGGYLALMCLLESKKWNNGDDYFSCGICAAGITDWFVQQRYTEVRYYDYALMGGWVYEKEIAARARALSPIHRAASLQAPLLVLHGDQDTDVPFQQIPPFVEAANRSVHHNASVDYHAYPGEGHGMSGTSEVQADYLDRIKSFLRIHLKPWDFTSNPHGDITAY